MRIGVLAAAIGVSADTIRFYERSGVLRGPSRSDNGYRDYSLDDATHLRLLIDLRRLDVPLDLASSLAQACHAGHCATTRTELPRLIERQRSEIAARMDGLRALDERLADLQRHLAEAPREEVPGAGLRLPMLESGGPCCDAASAVIGVAEGGCSCCATASPAVSQTTNDSWIGWPSAKRSARSVRMAARRGRRGRAPGR
jgi:DNA-binding transcriptional MerR regulator